MVTSKEVAELLVEVIVGSMVDTSIPGKILIVDDHEIVRVGLRLIIEEWGDYTVAGEAADGLEAVRQMERTNPDIIFMDVAMPVMDGIEATNAILKTKSTAGIIMLTADRGVDTVFAALASGAQGYCLKDISPERLHAGVNCVRLGDLWLDKEVAATISNIVRTDVRNAKQKVSKGAGKIKNEGSKVDYDSPVSDPLSTRELEILDLIVKGFSNKEIADRIFVSGDTVKTHVSHILKKLSASDRTHAAVKALRGGLVKM